MCLKPVNIFMLCFWLGVSSFLTTKCANAGEALIEWRMMKVTAYYGPEPGQGEYMESYKKDLKMNGFGKKTSSGRPPEIGTVSADKKYFPRGKKIDMYIPEYGSGNICDTGGAIKGPNRIDIYMGKGIKGLKKAKSWGVREVLVMLIRQDVNNS